MAHGTAIVLVLGIVMIIASACFRLKARRIAMNNLYPETTEANVVISSTGGLALGIVVSIIGVIIFAAPALSS